MAGHVVLAGVLDALSCPVCAEPLHQAAGALYCGNRHSFDVAREGYANLLPGGAVASTADTRSMVAARREFLAAGYLGAVADAVVAAARAGVRPGTQGVIVDAGGGTGEYLAALLDGLPERVGLVLDASKHAVRRAASVHARGAAIVCDVWSRLPLRTTSAALVTSIFAPRNADEFARVLAPGGALVVVTPTARHLAQLVGPLGLLTVDPRKPERLAEKLDPLFARTAHEVVEYDVALPRSHAVTAALMGPSAAHVSADELELRAQTLSDPIAVTVSVNVATFTPISEPAT